MTAFDIIRNLTGLRRALEGVGISGKFRIVMGEQDMRSLLNTCREEIQTVRMNGTPSDKWELVLADVPFETDQPLTVGNGAFLRDLNASIVNAGIKLGLHPNTATTLATEAILRLRETRMAEGKPK